MSEDREVYRTASSRHSSDTPLGVAAFLRNRGWEPIHHFEPIDPLGGHAITVENWRKIKEGHNHSLGWKWQEAALIELINLMGDEK